MEIDREEIQMVAKRILMSTTYEYADKIIDELGSEIVDDVIETADESWCDDDVRLAIGRTIVKRIKKPEVKRRTEMEEKNRLADEQIDAMETKLRQAQILIEEAAQIVCGVGGDVGPRVWSRLSSNAEDVGETICSLWRLRK